MRSLPGLRPLLVVLLAAPGGARAARVQPVPVPASERSQDFTVTVNRHPVDVARAAGNYDYVSFDITGPVEIAITAAEPGFWDRGVDIQPWRLGLRPTREGQTIRFRLDGPAKLSISRPGDFLNHARMLFVFAGWPPSAPKKSGMHIFPAGVYRQSLNPKSGETYYLAPGAFFYGSLNLWKVNNVRILGRGTIIYEGTQDPNADQGWMQRPDWHCIGALEARNVEIDGMTCIVRARTWSIQMKDSTGFIYDDLRVIGANAANANQDGMDWLGGGDAIVHNAFLRASDDDLAMEGNWDGYTEDDLRRPGNDVRNILVEESELSTSISNIVRLGWPEKRFNSSGFTLRDSDILHAGIGACGQTFGLLGIWGANGASGHHDNIHFENLFLDNWYSLAQIEQEKPAIEGVTFRNIWALDQPALAGSTITGSVSGVTFENVKFGQTVAMSDAALDLSVTGGAAQPRFAASSGPRAAFAFEPLVFQPGEKVTFTAQRSHGADFTWRFGDGDKAHGRRVHHRFKDAEGTELDGSGRFRVLLEATDDEGGQDWAAQSVVDVAQWHNAIENAPPTEPGLAYRVFPGAWTELPDLGTENAALTGGSAGLDADAQGFTRYAVAWDGFIRIPADGGYTFYVIARDGTRLEIDGVEVARTGPPFAQVCGSPGNAERFALGSLGLRTGLHSLHVENLHSASEGAPRLEWQGPGTPLVEVPAAAFSRARQNAP
jgi:hypothetical protein